MLPDHYIKAIDNVNKAMDNLFCADDELKTIEIYLDLKKILEKLNSL